MKTTQFTRILVCALTLVTVACNNSSKKTKTEQVQEAEIAYQCPMDCENGKSYNQPGKCVVCEMDLEKIKINN